MIWLMQKEAIHCYLMIQDTLVTMAGDLCPRLLYQR